MLPAPAGTQAAVRPRTAVVSAPTNSAAGSEQRDTSAATEEVTRSDPAARVIDWISTSRDNGALPYIVVDKKAAMLFLFDAEGKALGNAPVLIGIAPGDVSSPGVGSKVLARIGTAERTTPAGRFFAKYGLAAGGERVLWVDYADSVALHAVITTNKKEHRLQRLRSPTPDDKRITFGCINVPTSFYQRQIRHIFKKNGGIVYILPDTKSLEEVFPRLLAQPYLSRQSK